MTGQADEFQCAEIPECLHEMYSAAVSYSCQSCGNYSWWYWTYISCCLPSKQVSKCVTAFTETEVSVTVCVGFFYVFIQRLNALWVKLCTWKSDLIDTYLWFMVFCGSVLWCIELNAFCYSFSLNVFHSLIKKVSPEDPQNSFLQVARELFSDGIYNWGRIVTLFYFAFRLISRVCEVDCSLFGKFMQFKIVVFKLTCIV